MCKHNMNVSVRGEYDMLHRHLLSVDGSFEKLLLLDYACLARSMRDRLRFTIFYTLTHTYARARAYTLTNRH